MNAIALTDHLVERSLKQLERSSLQPPEHTTAPERPRFESLEPQNQRGLIRDHFRKWPCDKGLLGEAINEHRLAGSIEAAFMAGDMEQLGRLVDRAMREYLGVQIQIEIDGRDA